MQVAEVLVFPSDVRPHYALTRKRHHLLLLLLSPFLLGRDLTFDVLPPLIFCPDFRARGVEEKDLLTSCTHIRCYQLTENFRHFLNARLVCNCFRSKCKKST